MIDMNETDAGITENSDFLIIAQINAVVRGIVTHEQIEAILADADALRAAVLAGADLVRADDSQPFTIRYPEGQA